MPVTPRQIASAARRTSPGARVAARRSHGSRVASSESSTARALTAPSYRAAVESSGRPRGAFQLGHVARLARRFPALADFSSNPRGQCTREGGHAHLPRDPAQAGSLEHVIRGAGCGNSDDHVCDFFRRRLSHERGFADAMANFSVARCDRRCDVARRTVVCLALLAAVAGIAAAGPNSRHRAGLGSGIRVWRGGIARSGGTRVTHAAPRTGSVVGLTAAIDDLADLVGRLLIRVVRLGPNLTCLLTQLASKFRTRFRREEHSKAGPEHCAREQPHQERSATVFPFEAIIFVRHAPSCFAVSDDRPAAGGCVCQMRPVADAGCSWSPWPLSNDVITARTPRTTPTA